MFSVSRVDSPVNMSKTEEITYSGLEKELELEPEPFIEIEIKKETGFKSLSSYNLKTLNSLAKLIGACLSEEKNPKLPTSLLEFSLKQEKRFKAEVEAFYQQLPLLIKTYEEFNLDETPYLRNEVFHCTLMQFIAAIGILRASNPNLMRFAFSSSITTAISWLVASVIMKKDLRRDLFSASPLRFSLAEIEGKETMPSIDYVLRENSFLEEFLDKTNPKAVLNAFVKIVIEREVNLKLFNVEIKSYNFCDRRKELLELVRSFKHHYVKLLVATDKSLNEQISNLKASLAHFELQSLDEKGFHDFLKKNLSKRYASILSDCFSMLKFRKKDLKKLQEKSHLEAFELEPILRLKWLQLITIANKIILEKPEKELHLFVKRILTDEIEFFDQTITAMPDHALIEIEESLNSLKIHKFSKIEASYEFAKSDMIQENFCTPVITSYAETVYELMNFDSNEATETFFSLKNITFEWKISSQIILFYLFYINSEAFFKFPIVRFLKLSKKIESLGGLEEEQVFSSYKEKGVVIEPISNWKESSYYSLWAHFQKSVKDGSKQQLVLKKIEHLIQQFKIEFLKIQKIALHAPFFFPSWDKAFLQAAKGLVLINKSLHAFTKTLEDNQLTYSKEQFERIVGIIENEILPLFPENFKKEWMNVPELPRTSLETISGCFYSSTKLSDIDWKIVRYKAPLVTLKGVCLELFENEFGKENGKIQIDSFLDEEAFPEEAKKYLQKIIQALFKSEEYPLNLKNGAKEDLNTLRKLFSVKFIGNLRNLVSCKDNSPWKKMGLELAEALYIKTSLQKESALIVEKFYSWGAKIREVKDSPPFEFILSAPSIVPYLRSIYSNLNAVPYTAKKPIMNQLFSSAIGRWNVNFDPMTQGNLPHCLFDIQIQQRSVKVLGMGSPTIQEGLSNAKLCPEFQALLENLKLKKERHFFILNQNYIANNWRVIGEVETDRIDAIMEKANNDFDETLFVFLCSKNSHFYHQEHEYQDKNNSTDFMLELHDQFFLKPMSETGNGFSRNIQKLLPELDKFSENLIESIFRHAFKERDTLDKSEREIFIDIYQDFLSLHILIFIFFASMNATCKDAIDRAAQTIARLLGLIGIINDTYYQREFRLQIIILAFVRALMVRKRVIILSRLKRLEQGLNFYENNREALKAIFAELFQSIELAPLFSL